MPIHSKCLKSFKNRCCLRTEAKLISQLTETPETQKEKQMALLSRLHRHNTYITAKSLDHVTITLQGKEPYVQHVEIQFLHLFIVFYVQAQKHKQKNKV
jgi:hypothetical protein